MDTFPSRPDFLFFAESTQNILLWPAGRFQLKCCPLFCKVLWWVGCVLSLFQLFATLWTIACQAPLFMGFFRKEYWNGLLFLSLGDLPNPGIKPMSPVAPALQMNSLSAEPLRPCKGLYIVLNYLQGMIFGLVLRNNLGVF